MKTPRGADTQRVSVYVPGKLAPLIEALAKKFSAGNKALFILQSVDAFTTLFSLPLVLKDRLLHAAGKPEALDEYVREVLARHAMTLPDRPSELVEGDRTPLTLSLPLKLHAQLQQMAKDDGRENLSATIVDILEKVVTYYGQPRVLAARLNGGAEKAGLTPALYIQDVLSRHAVALPEAAPPARESRKK